MIKKEVYQCEVCGTQYRDKDECRKCEEFHARIPASMEQNIFDTRYEPTNQNGSPFPFYLTIAFKDGRKAQYKYNREIRDLK